MRPPRDREPREEELVYAALLRRGTWFSVAVLVLTFLLYAGGLVAPLVPIERLPQHWGLRAGEYLRAAGLPDGWGWVRFVGFGDVLNYVGVAMLAGLTVVCYLAVLVVYLGRKDTLYALMILAELAVLVLAASGLLVLGH